MFPTLNYTINYLFGTNFTFNFPPTFGTLVALAILSAAWALTKEMKRKERSGIFKPLARKVIVGEPVSAVELATNSIIGFVIGFKLIGVLMNLSDFKADPQGYILSSQGSLIGGLLWAAIAGGWKYYDKKKKQLPKPKEELVTIRPYQTVGNITLVAAITGIIGAKIFHQLEYWDTFVKDPIGNLLSPTGLTFYGSIIGGAIGIWWYLRKLGYSFVHFADALAPGLMLAYAVGRIGCMMSGDGDWGIINSAYRITDDRQYVAVPAGQIDEDLARFDRALEDKRYAYYKKPAALSFLPTWMFAFDFPHNVNEEGIRMQDCNGQYCARLPLPVFPTPFYETIVCLIMFAVLWLIRKRIHVPGMLVSIYFILNGIERFFIEKIRVNSVYHLGAVEITQAEIIALVLILIGTVGVILAPKYKAKLSKI